MAIRFHSEDLKNKYERKAHKVIFFSMFLLLISVAYIIFQFIKGVFSAFNIISLGILIFIFVNAVITTAKTKTNDQGLFYEENYGLNKEEKEKYTQQEAKNLEGKSYSHIIPLSKKASIIRWVATILLIVAGIVMFCIGPNIYKTSNCTSVTATVISQYGEDHTETTEYENGGYSSFTYSRCVVEVSYDFNGTNIIDTIYINGTKYIHSNSFEILLDDSGNFVRTTIESTKFYIFAGILVFAGILLGLSAYFSVSSIIFLALVFLLISSAVLLFVCMPVSISEVVFVEFGSIPVMFFVIALYWFNCFIITPMFLPRDLSTVAEVTDNSRKNLIEKRGNQIVIGRAGDKDIEEYYQEMRNQNNKDLKWKWFYRQLK